MNDNGKITEEQAHLWGAIKGSGVEMSEKDLKETLENAPEIDWPMVIIIFCVLLGGACIAGYLIWYVFFHLKVLN